MIPTRHAVSSRPTGSAVPTGPSVQAKRPPELFGGPSTTIRKAVTANDASIKAAQRTVPPEMRMSLAERKQMLIASFSPANQRMVQTAGKQNDMTRQLSSDGLTATESLADGPPAPDYIPLPPHLARANRIIHTKGADLDKARAPARLKALFADKGQGHVVVLGTHGETNFNYFNDANNLSFLRKKSRNTVVVFASLPTHADAAVLDLKQKSNGPLSDLRAAGIRVVGLDSNRERKQLLGFELQREVIEKCASSEKYKPLSAALRALATEIDQAQASATFNDETRNAASALQQGIQSLLNGLPALRPDDLKGALSDQKGLLKQVAEFTQSFARQFVSKDVDGGVLATDLQALMNKPEHMGKNILLIAPAKALTQIATTYEKSPIPKEYVEMRRPDGSVVLDARTGKPILEPKTRLVVDAEGKPMLDENDNEITEIIADEWNPEIRKESEKGFLSEFERLAGSGKTTAIALCSEKKVDAYAYRKLEFTPDALNGREGKAFSKEPLLAVPDRIFGADR